MQDNHKNFRRARPVRSRVPMVTESSNEGFSTLEILMAMFIVILILSAVVLVSFGNQSVIADSQTSTEALNKAQELLENAQALARKDFKLVNPISTTTPDGFYREQVDITLASSTDPNLPDFFTKKVKATVSWTGDHNRSESVSLSALVTNFENAVGGDTCNSALSGNWQNPQILSFPIGNLIGDPSGVYPITDIDAYQGKLYVTVGNASASTSPTFFIFNISDPANPVLDHSGSDKIDNDIENKTGLNAVAVADYVAPDGTKHKYAYIASASSFTKGQLQVIDVSDNVSPPQVVNTFKIDPAIVSGSGAGNSIFYKDGYLYLGLANTGSGPEFNIIDVHDPLNPQRWGGFSIGNDINVIYVKGKYAYVVSPNNQEVIILNIINPTDPVKVGGFDAASGSGNGKSLYSVGDVLYLGRTVGGTEFYILDNKNPATNQLPELGSKADIDISIDGLIIRDYLAFLLTKTQFQILKIDQFVTPWGISQWASPNDLPAGASTAFEPAFDCEDNNFFVGSNDDSNNGYLSVIRPGP